MGNTCAAGRSRLGAGIDPYPARCARDTRGEMGGQPTYSDEQRDAIVAAVLDDGFTAREASVKAAAGETRLRSI